MCLRLKLWTLLYGILYEVVSLRIRDSYETDRGTTEMLLQWNASNSNERGIRFGKLLVAEYFKQMMGNFEIRHSRFFKHLFLRVTNHSPQSVAEVKNTCIYTSISQVRLHGEVLTLNLFSRGNTDRAWSWLLSHCNLLPT